MNEIAWLDDKRWADSKKHWLAENLRCPLCESYGRFEWRRWICDRCEHTCNAVENSISFLQGAERIDPSVGVSAPVSAHPYNETAMRLVSEVERIGGMALDCGCGSRTFTSDRLVQVDIVPYPNVDILAINQRLPFAENSFDLVMSFDVLEHVSDPWASAREIIRVLKPGGIVHVDIPFMAGEHGYPHDYFRATQMGLRKLFENLDLIAHVVLHSGHPTQTLNSVLTAFRAGLPPERRPEFEAMTVAQLLAIPHKQLHRELCEVFSEEVKWKLASCTQALFAKPGERRVAFELSDLPQFAVQLA